MKNFFIAVWKFLKSAWVLWTLLLLVLIAFVWFVFPYIPFLKNHRLLAILILVAIWGMHNFWLRYKKETQKEAQENKEYTPEQLAVAFQEIQNAFRTAIQAIPKIQINWFNLSPKILPWYVTLGVDDAGKTSALLNSGLPFPIELNDPKANTDYATWRYSQVATFLDVRGSLITHNRETDNLTGRVWNELLRLIQQYRYRKSFNGIILSIDVSSLLSQSEEILAVQTYHLSRALQDLEKVMGFKCPLYVQFTKTDILNGFKEFSDLLSIEEQQQGLGFSLPNDANPLQHVSAKFNALIDQLHTKALFALPHEKNVQKAATAALFPSELQGLKKRIERFFELLFEANQFRERAYLRGVFFTSAVFGPKAQQHLLQPYIHEFGLKLRAPNYLINSKAGNVILGMYQRFILAEKNVYRFSVVARREFFIRNGLILSAAGALFMSLLYFWSVSYEQNQLKLEQLNNHARHYLLALRSAATNLTQRKAQLLLLDEMDRVFDPAKDPSSLGWGLYQGNKITANLKDFYVPVLREQFVPVLMDDIKKTLRDPHTSLGMVYEFLRVYLMLGDKDRLQKDFVYGLLSNYWADVYHEEPELRNLLTNSLQGYLKYSVGSIKLEPNVISAARERLKDLSPSEQVYAQLLALGSGNTYSLIASFAQEFNQIFDAQHAITTIPILFTYQGYHEIFLKQLNPLMESINHNDWVLGVQRNKVLTPEQKEAIKQRVQSLYMNQYISTWKHVLSTIKIAPSSNLSQVQDKLTLLSQSNSIVESLLRVVNTNTILLKGDKELPPGATKSAITTKKVLAAASKGKSGAKSLASPKDAVKNIEKASSVAKSLNLGGGGGRTPVGTAFYDLNQLTLSDGDDGASPFTSIHAELVALDQLISSITASSEAGKAAFTLAAQHAQGGGEDAIGTMVKLANQLPEPVKSWFMDLAQGSWRMILGSGFGFINQQWASSVYPQYESLILAYPFNKNTPTEVDPDQLAAFLNKDGTLDKFITTYLAPFVNTTSTPWKLIVADGASLPIANLNKLYAWAQLRNVLFGKGEGKQINVQFTVTPIQLDRTAFMAQLKVGDKTITALHGPQTSEGVTWIPDHNGVASLQMTALNYAVTNVVKNGMWAWFKLLETGQFSGTGSTVNVKFDVYGKTVTYALKTPTTVNPFNLPALRALTLPSSL
jgi:type VI secretion system protein ImpL